MPFGNPEARLRRLGGRVGGLEQDVRVLRDRYGKIAQDLAALGGGVGSSNTCVTTVEGRVIGCLLTPTPLPGSTIQIVGHTTGFDYGTYALATGEFSLGLYLMDDDGGLDISVWGPDPTRHAVGTTLDVDFLRCDSDNLGDFQVPPASGYHCAPYFCAWPIADTLDVVDSRYGSDTATYVGAPVWRAPFASNPRHEISAFASATGLGVMRSHFTGPPPTDVDYGPTRITSQTCPASGGVKFSVVYTVPSTGSFYTAGDTIEFKEP